MMMVTIGLPRAMLYYRYHVLWETFFQKLGCRVVASPPSNKNILEWGIQYSIDECCLPSKIYMGHVYALIGKCDYILIPRVENYGQQKDVCVKFNALYDIVRNTFPQVPLLHYNIDHKRRDYQWMGFVKMGRQLGYGFAQSLQAYRAGKKAQALADRQKVERQQEAIHSYQGCKILMMSHPYNMYDRLIGYPIAQYVQQLGGLPVYADATDRADSLKQAKSMSETLYWLYNQELIGSIKLLERHIDGIILLTAFPCGPDSLVNELLIRKFKQIPTINIVLDELQGEAGLQTRIESFMDIIKQRAAVSPAG